MIGEDVLYLPIRRLAELLRTRQLSPVELSDSYLARSERIGPALNARNVKVAEVFAKTT